MKSVIEMLTVIIIFVVILDCACLKKGSIIHASAEC